MRSRRDAHTSALQDFCLRHMKPRTLRVRRAERFNDFYPGYACETSVIWPRATGLCVYIVRVVWRSAGAWSKFLGDFAYIALESPALAYLPEFDGRLEAQIGDLAKCRRCRLSEVAAR